MLHLAQVERDWQKVQKLTLNRPEKVNCLTEAFSRELMLVLQEIGNDWETPNWFYRKLLCWGCHYRNPQFGGSETQSLISNRMLENGAFRCSGYFFRQPRARFAEKSQIFRALRSALAVTGENIFALKAP